MGPEDDLLKEKEEEEFIKEITPNVPASDIEFIDRDNDSDTEI